MAVLLIARHFSKGYFYEREEIQLCQQFLERNEKVIDTVGLIKNIKVDFKSAYIEGAGDDLSGRYNFVVDGSKAKERFFVNWESKSGRFSVKEIVLVRGITDKEVWKYKVEQ